MFNNMKNQVREKTGREVPKFTPQKGGLSRQSRQGSESSLSSLVVEPVTLPQLNSQNSSGSSPISDSQLKLPDGRLVTAKEVALMIKKEDELLKKLDKKDAEWKLKLDRKEAEFVQEKNDKRDEWKKREQVLIEDSARLANELKEAQRYIEDYKRKIYQYQEDKDQLEGFQIQEMAKVKHLLLAKEKENSEISATLKENLTMVETLKSEVNRLRPFEEQISNFQDDIEMLRHTYDKERWQLTSKLAQSEEQVRHLTDRVAVLTRRTESDVGSKNEPDERIQVLLDERALLERRLEETHLHLSDIKASWSSKISSLETQVGRLSRQAGEEGSERRRAESRIAELETKLEEEIKEKEKVAARAERIAGERDGLAADLKAVTSSIEAQKTENTDLAENLGALETSLSLSKAECERLNEELKREIEKREKTEEDLLSIRAELKALGDRTDVALATEKAKIEDLTKEVENERKVKDEALIRNVQLSQEVDIARQELRQQQADTEDLYKKVGILEGCLQDKDQELNKYKSEVAELLGRVSSLQTEAEARQVASGIEENLRETIAELETQLSDRNKNIRVLQQRLSDMKKTLQRELKASEPSTNENMSNHHVNAQGSTKNNLDEDVNFLYLKHVIIKFLTSREYEAQHLTKAVATLLKLTPEEEGLLKDTLDWRMSWFRTRPKLQNHQLSS